MTNSFKTVLRNPGATAPAGNPTYNTDAVDRAVYALGTVSGTPPGPSHVLAYIRAKRWPTVSGFTSGLVDRLGNPVSSGSTYAANAVKNATDANFNGQSSIDLTSVSSAGASSGLATMGPGFGLNGTGYTTLPTSFTFAASLRLNSSGAPSVNNIYSTSEGNSVYCTAAGAMQCYIGGSTDANFTTVTAPPGTAVVSWMSYDSSTKIWRAGYNTSTVLQTHTGTHTYTPTANDKIGLFCYDAQLNNGQCFSGQFEGYLVLDKAYMNGSVPADDAQFTTLISTWAALI